MKKLNLDQKMLMKSIAIVIVTDPLFTKNAIIKTSKTHNLNPNNEYLCKILKPIFDNIEERTNFNNDTYLHDLKTWVKLIEHYEVKTILTLTIEEHTRR